VENFVSHPTTTTLLVVLLAASAIVVVLIMAGEMIGNGIRIVVVVGIVSILALILLIEYHLRWRLIRSLAACDRDTQDRILAQLDPAERAKILRLLRRVGMDS
jgi:hypothetical protein